MAHLDSIGQISFSFFLYFVQPIFETFSFSACFFIHSLNNNFMKCHSFKCKIDNVIVLKKKKKEKKFDEAKRNYDIWPQHTMFMHDELSKKEISFFLLLLSPFSLVIYMYSCFFFVLLLGYFGFCVWEFEILMHQWLILLKFFGTVECTKEKCEMSRFNSCLYILRFNLIWFDSNFGSLILCHSCQILYSDVVQKACIKLWKFVYSLCKIWFMLWVFFGQMIW